MDTAEIVPLLKVSELEDHLLKTLQEDKVIKILYEAETILVIEDNENIFDLKSYLQAHISFLWQNYKPRNDFYTHEDIKAYTKTFTCSVTALMIQRIDARNHIKGFGGLKKYADLQSGSVIKLIRISTF